VLLLITGEYDETLLSILPEQNPFGPKHPLLPLRCLPPPNVVGTIFSFSLRASSVVESVHDYMPKKATFDKS
jgi:hypothetical protein